MAASYAIQSGIGPLLRVAYFVHDLSDPAVARRVEMLRAGGSDVILLGFQRGAHSTGPMIAGAPAIKLGRSHDGRFISRIASILAVILCMPAWIKRMGRVDVLLARNLEMLAVARAVRAFARPQASVAYEVLDIHRLLLGNGMTSAALGAVERWLMRGASRLVVSSPAFIRQYFQTRDRPQLPVVMVENKVLCLDTLPSRPQPRPTGPPWRIGWFGMIRCQRSLDILTDLARQSAGSVQIEIRGRPALTAIKNFHEQVAAAEGVSFHGSYDASELPALYGGVHFVWAIDYYEAGLNSNWLLPNRLYEGQMNGAVALALRTVETARWLERRRAGVLFSDPREEIGKFFNQLNESLYLELANRTLNIPLADLLCDRRECETLVRALKVPEVV